MFLLYRFFEFFHFAIIQVHRMLIEDLSVLIAYRNYLHCLHIETVHTLNKYIQEFLYYPESDSDMLQMHYIIVSILYIVVHLYLKYLLEIRMSLSENQMHILLRVYIYLLE